MTDLAKLKAAEAAGARIQAYTVPGDDGSAALISVEGMFGGYWRTLEEPAKWSCHPTRYRAHPEDVA